MRRIAILNLLLVCLLAACASTPPLGGAPDIRVTSMTEMPAPMGTDLLTANRPYLIGPFDKLKIDVFGITELSGKEVQADASGNISFPLVGVVEASGKTPGELAVLLEKRLQGRFVRKPQVSVNLEETVSQVVTVDGQVQTPGLYPVLGRMTLIRAVARAGGTSEFAKMDDVVLFRTVDGQKYAGLYNLGAIRRGIYEDPEIFANDIIIVGESKSQRMFRNILQASPLLTTPLVILFQRI